jgi:hypothetical protein
MTRQGDPIFTADDSPSRGGDDLACRRQGGGVVERDHAVAQKRPALLRVRRDNVRGQPVRGSGRRARRVVAARADGLYRLRDRAGNLHDDHDFSGDSVAQLCGPVFLSSVTVPTDVSGRRVLTGLGDAQLAKGDSKGARASWTQALSDLPHADTEPVQARLDHLG